MNALTKAFPKSSVAVWARLFFSELCFGYMSCKKLWCIKNCIKQWQFKQLWKLLENFLVTFGKHCEKRRKCWKPAFSPFLTMFSTLSKCIGWATMKLLLALFNPLPNNPWFLWPWDRCHLKTLWEKEKVLVTSIFSFSHNVFYPAGNKFQFLS